MEVEEQLVNYFYRIHEIFHMSAGQTDDLLNQLTKDGN
jgi:hypothetical protein